MKRLCKKIIVCISTLGTLAQLNAAIAAPPPETYGPTWVLAEAIKSCSPDIVTRALENVPDINAYIQTGLTALQLACRDNHAAIAYLLLEHPAIKPNTPARDHSKFTALHFAVARNNVDCVVALLKYHEEHKLNLNLDTTDEGGNSPLRLAAETGNHMILALLVEAGASTIIPDIMGKMPEHSAEELGHTEITKLLAAVAGDPDGSRRDSLSADSHHPDTGSASGTDSSLDA